MIRSITKGDIPAIKEIIDSSNLFPSEMIDDMTKDYLSNPTESKEIWLTEVVNEKPVSVVFCRPEYMTEGTYNTMLLAVSVNCQGKGHGSRLMKFLEEELPEDARLLMVETSGDESFDRTRSFYERIGFSEEARIREYYQAGEDKIVYCKKITQRPSLETFGVST